MDTWKAIGVGLLAFPVTAVVALVGSPPTVLLAGFPSGFVAGYASDGFLAGVVSSIVTGVGIAVLFFSVGYYLATAPERPAPGVGLGIFLIAIAAVGLAVESAVAGTVGSLANR
jgi:hypothetical protein